MPTNVEFTQEERVLRLSNTDLIREAVIFYLQSPSVMGVDGEMVLRYLRLKPEYEEDFKQVLPRKYKGDKYPRSPETLVKTNIVGAMGKMCEGDTRELLSKSGRPVLFCLASNPLPGFVGRPESKKDGSRGSRPRHPLQIVKSNMVKLDSDQEYGVRKNGERVA